MKVSALTGALLDYWVARAEGWEIDPLRRKQELQIRIKHSLTHPANHLYSEDGYCYALCGADRPFSYSPSTDWQLAGPIIEREGIHLERDVNGYSTRDARWCAECGVFWDIGSTPLIAAMRAFVTSKYGDEVPDAEAQTQ